MQKAKWGLNNLESALRKLLVAVRRKNLNKLERDGAIKRFEFTFELFWKTFKKALEDGGDKVEASPRAVLAKAYAIGWIEDEKLWILMLKDRNSTAHEYDETQAKQVYKRVVRYAPAMQDAFKKLSGYANRN